MDEKTVELRDLFVETTGADTVTERQAESRGTLIERDEQAVTERLRELIAAMRERYEFSTSLDDATYAQIARGRFNERNDAAVADAIEGERTPSKEGQESIKEGQEPIEEGQELIKEGRELRDDAIAPETVRDARFDLHLVRESDRAVPDDAGFTYTDLKQLTAAGNSLVECATALDADIDTVAQYATVARVDLASTRANDRFRDEFRDLLTDADIEGHHATDAREDGLRDATEDLETDVYL